MVVLINVEKIMLLQMTKKMVKPGQILLKSKIKMPKNVTTIKTVYNERQRYWRKQVDPRTEVQHLLKLIECDQYVYWFKRVDTLDVVKDIMWSHPDSIKLLNSFSTVFICDTTYKMNKYHLPLLEIVGVTSIKMTFSVAFAYLQFERMDNFEWALNKVKGLFVKDDVLLYVIVIGKDLVLISALKVVLPFSTN